MKLIATVICLLAFPATAGAAWTTESVPSDDTLEITGFGFGRSGHGLLAYEGFRDSAPRKFTGLVTDGGAWRREADLRGITWGEARLDHYGSDRVLLTALKRYAFKRFGRAAHALVVAFGRSDGSFGDLRTLDRDGGEPVAAVNARGAAVVGWTRTLSGRVRVALRAPGRGFGEMRSVSPEGADAPAVAINPRGDVLVAWARAGFVEARIKRAGRAWGRIRRAGNPRLDAATIRAAMGPAGRALLGWGATNNPSGEDDPTTFEHGLSLYARGWKSTRLDSYSRAAFTGLPQVVPAFDPRGRALAAWMSESGFRVAGVTGDRSEVIAALPASNATLDGFAVSEQGALAATWSVVNGATGPFVTVSRDGTSFEPPADLHAAGSTSHAPSALAFRFETPFVAWPASTSGPRPTIRVARPE